MMESHSSERQTRRGAANPIHEIWQLGRRTACAVLLAISLSALANPSWADDCDSALAEEQDKLEDYLAKELSYKVAKFTTNWIETKRVEFASTTLLASDMAQAEDEISQLELEVEQAENAYHAAHSSRISVCSDG